MRAVRKNMVDKSQNPGSKDASLKEVLNSLLGKKLAEKRRSLGLTQEELSEILSLNSAKDKTRTIQRWEAGKTPVPAWVMTQLDLIESQVHHLANKQEKHDFILQSATLVEQTHSHDFMSKVKDWFNKLI